MGWHANYICTLMQVYHYTKEYVLFELPMHEGYILQSHAIFNDPINKFNGIGFANGGYLGQECDKLFNEIKTYNTK